MRNSFEYRRAEAAAQYIKKQIGPFQPRIAAVLGSGLGNYADSGQMDVQFQVPYREIPDFPVSTVSGHAGQFLFGHVRGVPVALMQGRVHQYEGYSAADTVLPVRVLKLLGADCLILTNAAGGIHPAFCPGDFMLIRDHIATFVPSPLKGENPEELGARFPDMTEVYSHNLIRVAKGAARGIGVPLQEGVYLQTAGPQYETPAEIRMMSLFGADAVGMSTACEAIAARHMDMQVCGISCITNKASGLGGTALSHEEVQKIADQTAGRFQELMTELIAEIAAAMERPLDAAGRT